MADTRDQRPDVMLYAGYVVCKSIIGHDASHSSRRYENPELRNSFCGIVWEIGTLPSIRSELLITGSKHPEVAL